MKFIICLKIFLLLNLILIISTRSNTSHHSKHKQDFLNKIVGGIKDTTNAIVSKVIGNKEPEVKEYEDLVASVAKISEKQLEPVFSFIMDKNLDQKYATVMLYLAVKFYSDPNNKGKSFTPDDCMLVGVKANLSEEPVENSIATFVKEEEESNQSEAAIKASETIADKSKILMQEIKQYDGNLNCKPKVKNFLQTRLKRQGVKDFFKKYGQKISTGISNLLSGRTFRKHPKTQFVLKKISKLALTVGFAFLVGAADTKNSVFNWGTFGAVGLVSNGFKSGNSIWSDFFALFNPTKIF